MHHKTYEIIRKIAQYPEECSYTIKSHGGFSIRYKYTYLVDCFIARSRHYVDNDMILPSKDLQRLRKMIDFIEAIRLCNL